MPPFFGGGLFKVEGVPREGRRKPRISVEADFADLISLRLAKAGWWGGDPAKVKEAPVDEVMKALQYEQFVADYESAFMALNREE